MTAVCSITSQSAADRALSRSRDILAYLNRKPLQLPFKMMMLKMMLPVSHKERRLNLLHNNHLIFSPCQKWAEMTKMRRRRNQQRVKLRRRLLWVEYIYVGECVKNVFNF